MSLAIQLTEEEKLKLVLNKQKMNIQRNWFEATLFLDVEHWDNKKHNMVINCIGFQKIFMILLLFQKVGWVQ